MTSFGFIITRHVNSPTTNSYWNRSIKLLSVLYPSTRIIVIDDNSNYDHVSQDIPYPHITIIQSEFPKRGELLPYYYWLKHKWFARAVIIHDSVFFHKRIRFETIPSSVPVLPLWHFSKDLENRPNIMRLVSLLSNSRRIQSMMDEMFMMKTQPWDGCFGVQCYMTLPFLEHLERTYKITKLISGVTCRADRCCLERIFGALFFSECPELIKQRSLLGNIMQYQTWGYSYGEYHRDVNDKKVSKPIVKVWTGR